MWALVGDKQRFRLWKHGTANCVGLVRETASDLVALKWLRRRRRRNIIDTHHSVAGRTRGRSKQMSRLSCHIHRNFASLFYERKKSGASNAAARKVAVAAQGRREGRREERQNCTKIPISRHGRRRRRSPSRRLACVPTSSPRRLRRRERRTERATEGGKRPEGSRDCSRLSRSGFVSGKKTIFILHLIFPTAANAYSQLTATAG